MRSVISKASLMCAVLAVCGSFAAEGPDEVEFKEGEMPPAAKPGEAYCLVTKPATYKTVTEQVLIRPQTFFMETVPAKFETREEKIQVAPESKRAVVVPAKYKTEKFQQIVKEESVRYEIIPAEYQTVDEMVVVRPDSEQLAVSQPKYKTVSEQILVSPARTYWKKVGPGGKSDKVEANGDCYCLCEVPAKYVTITKQIPDGEAAPQKVLVKGETKCVRIRKQVKAAEVKKIVVPAEYVTLDREVIETPAAVTYETIPAKWETIQKEVQVEPETKRKVDVPAKYETTTKQILDQPSKMVWRRYKCDCGDIIKKYKEIPGTDEASLLKLSK
jgi:hypothetical protein